jgi:glycosyltransferase involved in cell wall biosynthesis
LNPPLYKKERYIGRANNSVLNQTFQDFELIVVDDGSIDNSFKIAQNYISPKIKLNQKENEGESSYRNYRIETNRYICTFQQPKFAEEIYVCPI